MKKLLALLGAGMLVAMWSGCGVTDPASSVTIKIESIGAVVSGGAAGQVTGTIETDSLLTNVTMKVLKGSTDVTSSFTVSFTSAYMGKKNADLKTDMLTTITAKAGTAADTYTLSITAEAGSVTSTSTKDFAVTGGSSGTPVTSKSVTLGAQSAAEPSLLDADNMTVYSNTTTDATLQANADAIFVYSTVLTPAALCFTSPSVAAGSPYTSWTTKAAAEYKKVTVTDLTTIDTQEDIDALWGTGAGETRIALAQGDVIIIKTSAGVYKLASITAINGTNESATMTILGKY